MNEPTIETQSNQPDGSEEQSHETELVDASEALRGVPLSVVDGSNLKAAAVTAVREIDSKAEPHRDRRLHLATLWLPWLEMLVGITLPVLITCLFLPFGLVMYFVGCFGLLPVALFHVLRYATFRYRVNDAEFVLFSGVLFRRERRIPFDRVQELAIHQSVIHRLLDLAKLDITTAGSDGQEASLNVVTRQVAEDLKATVSDHLSQTKSALTGTPAANEPDYVCQLSRRDLLLGGLTSRIVASLGAVIAAIVYFRLFLGIGDMWWGTVEENLDGVVKERFPAEQALSSLTRWFEAQVPDLGPLNFLVGLFFVDTLTKSLTLVVLGLGGSVLAYMARYDGFRLTRRNDSLSTSFGLLTTRRNSLPRDRIQALKVEESLLRRFLGLASIRVDSAGDRKEIDETKKRDVLVPVATKQMAQEVAKQAIPGLEQLEPPWHPISRLAVGRGSRKGWLLVLLCMLLTYTLRGWLCLLWLPAFPFVYVLNYQWYRNTGYWLADHHFLSRKGWLNRATICLPIKNVQNVSVSQSFFDRRLNLATLSIDTAGQSNTGGGPVIRHLPVGVARSIQRKLARQVAACGFVW